MCLHYLLQSTFQHMKIDSEVRLKVNNALYIIEEILGKVNIRKKITSHFNYILY